MNSVVPFLSLPPITPEQLRSYALASGDQNPIHLEESAAQAAGLPGVIAHGMLTGAFIGERALCFARGLAGMEKCRVVRIQSRFRAMTLIGDVISIGGVVKEKSAIRVVLELSARNQRGETTTTGEVELATI